MSRYIDPVPQYLLNNGDLASDGYLYFFENLDYLTPKNTYNYIGAANPNPVRLDGEGRVPDIFGSGLYSVIFKSSDLVTQWTKDGVTIDPSLAGLGNTIVGDLSFSVDNSAIRSNSVDVIQFTSSTGIPKFPIGLKAPNSAISDPLVMDWYEEGSITPTAQGSTTSGTGTYVSQTGTFTRIGNRVFFNIYLVWTAHTGTGSIKIYGLPYTTVSGPYSYSVNYNGLTVGAGKQLCTRSQGSVTNIDLFACDPSGGAIVAVPMDTDVTEISINGSYRCA